MNDNRRNLQQALMSFALMGGMLVNTKQINAPNNRLAHYLSALLPKPIRRQRA